MECGYYHPSRGYWQTLAKPSEEELATYPEGTIEVSIKPGSDYEWQNGGWVYVEPIPPTQEEARALMPAISKRQLRLTLVRNGISLLELDAAIQGMGDEAVIEWQDSSEYRRLHPLLNQVAAQLSLTQEQIDTMWQQAFTA